MVADFAHEVKACALGQASSSIMARYVVGSTVEELRAVREAMMRMLKENGAPPDGKWADLRVLEPVRDYKARHASTHADLRRRGERARPDRGAAGRRCRSSGLRPMRSAVHYLRSAAISSPCRG